MHFTDLKKHCEEDERGRDARDNSRGNAQTAEGTATCAGVINVLHV